MEPVRLKIPIHRYCPVTRLKDNRMGNCCGIKFEAASDGYYCSRCDYFFHKSCNNNAPEVINHSFHKCAKPLELSCNRWGMRCAICRVKVKRNLVVYGCWDHMDSVIHLECVKYPPPEIIEVPQNHEHQLKLEMVETRFTCTACGMKGNGYSYKCHVCDLNFHVNCKKYGAEVNHPSHSLHPLMLLYGEPPAYTDGKCTLCGKRVTEAFYHCSTCNFTLDLHCVLDPPPENHHDLNIHDHQLTLLPKLFSFTCTTCGLNGDRSPYVCLQCKFTAHNDCSGFPWVININRHDHRVSRTSLLGVVNSVCGVCQKKMDWSCGGYSCKKCPGSVYHTKCATRKDVSNGIELKDEPEEDEDVEPFKVIDENTIRHFNHLHNLRLDKSNVFIEERSCEACAYPIYHHSFYSCMTCPFLIHESCANFPKWKRHVVSNKLYKLHTPYGYEKCEACGVCFNGFKYGYGDGLDMRCASVTEPFLHKSHHHPLFYTSPQGVCSACNKKAHHVLRCVEDDCEYVLDFECALLPYEVKHRVDDHFLSLCYTDKASGTYWCDICEQQTDPKSWFYTCKDCGVTLHTRCVLGDSRNLRPCSEVATNYGESRYFEVIRNNSMSRPLCSECKSRCLFPVILKVLYERSISDIYYCSVNCISLKYKLNPSQD